MSVKINILQFFFSNRCKRSQFRILYTTLYLPTRGFTCVDFTLNMIKTFSLSDVKIGLVVFEFPFKSIKTKKKPNVSYLLCKCIYNLHIEFIL